MNWKSEQNHYLDDFEERASAALTYDENIVQENQDDS